jgi:hypothetical protein
MNARMIRLGLAILATLGAAQGVAQPRWRLTEELRIGGSDEGPASFNEIREIAVDAKDRVFVLDYQTQEIRLFGADGKFIKLVGRKGAGPGEYRQPNGMRLAPDGTLWVNDHRNGRYVVFTPEGEFAKQVLAAPWGWGFRWDGAFDAQGRLMETIPLRAPGAQSSSGRVVRRFDPAKATFDSLPIPACFTTGAYQDWSVQWKAGTSSGVFSVPFAPLALAHITPTGAWLCAMGEEYRLKLMRFEGGTTISEIKSTSAPIPIPQAVRDSVIATLYKPPSPIPPGTLDESRVPKNFPRIEEVDVDDEGRIWVRRRVGGGLAFDVWSFNGTQLATITAPIAFEKFRPLYIRNNKLYVVIGDSDGVPIVVRYAIVRAAG